jgi:signal transduction histidine kinase
MNETIGAFAGDKSEILTEMVLGSPIPMFVIDRNHCVTHFNKACEILTGIPASEIIGTSDQWRAFYASRRPVMADIVIDDHAEERLESYYKGKYRASEVKPGAFEAEDYFPDMGEDGRWLFFTAVPLKDDGGRIIGAVETLQDITREKNVAELNGAMLRISQSLYNYSYLEDLLSYVSLEIRQLLGSEGAVVTLLDKEAGELYLPGIAYDDPSTERRVKGMRFSVDEVLAGDVIVRREPVIVNDCSRLNPYPERDRKMGYVTRNLVEVPIFAEDRAIGVLCGINKKGGNFSNKDVDILTMLAGIVALAIENTRYSEELRALYREVRALNVAKDKAINHLSHELKTPVAILADAVKAVEDELESLPGDDWKPFMNIIRRNVKRIHDIKEEVEDIIKGNEMKHPALLAVLLDLCADLLAVASSREAGDPGMAARIRQRIDDLFRPASLKSVPINPDLFVHRRLSELQTEFKHRDLDIFREFEKTPPIDLPEEIMTKLVDGLVKNAIENTPDGGRIELIIEDRGDEILFRVRDHGVGIDEESQLRIFEGFFPTQEMTRYATRKPFDFNAGGKGADLLRLKIFSETYGFTLSMTSIRCPALVDGSMDCPGNVGACPALTGGRRCHENMGGSEFTVRFRRSRGGI